MRAVEPNNYVCQVISRHIWLSSCDISSIRGEEEGTNANNNYEFATSCDYNAALNDQVTRSVSSTEGGGNNNMSRTDLDSHANMVVIGKNAVILNETG